ncbi:gas vesicle protein [Pseudoroseomonas cervicalis]|uniref:gas vesicle protein n=1 Tax=Teichococcus cervicalis TaxID=204525 RepID=UPI0022F1D15A|nr:gas vesicle protein [Pseudoroseomonas cervicalis]WBV43500.1 gas vesicle protein [Pseudoroseomonas cervicalis]
MSLQHSIGGSSLADILERILDKGIVVAGDISVNLVGVELLTVRLRLVIASVDRATEMGIRWWESDTAYRGGAPPPAPLLAETERLRDENRLLAERLARLEHRLEAGA